MAKTMLEVKEQLREGKGTAFSKSGFDSLTSALLNDKEYKGFEKVKVKGGDLVKEQVNPVEELKDFYVKMLTGAGLDKAEATVYVAEKLTISKGDVSYMQDLINEILYHFMDTGKSYTLGQREDFQAKISKKPVEEATNEYRNLSDTTGEAPKIKIHVQKHDKCVVKSVAPKWLKNNVK